MIPAHRIPSQLLVCLALALFTTIATAQNYRPGDKVVVIADTKLTVKKSQVDDVWAGLVLQVGDVNGQWLWVSNGKPGWLDRKHVIPLDRAAIDRLTALIRVKPQDPRLYSGRADIWKNLGELDIAIGDYNEAIRLKPTAAAYYNNRGLVWRAKGELDKALADYNGALRLNPKYTSAYNNRGVVWSETGELDKALADYNEALRLDPKYTSAYINRGNVWSDKGELDKALADYNGALRLNPKYRSAYNNRGVVWSDKGELDKALADYNEALRLDPKYTSAYKNRGKAWRAKGELDKALADYNEALRLDPKDSTACYYVALMQMHLRPQGAAATFQRALDLEGWEGSRAVYDVILGHLAARQAKDDQRARKFLDDSAEKLSKDWPSPVVRFLRGELDEPALLKLATDNGQQTEAHCYLGLDHRVSGRKEQAEEHFRWVRDQGKKTFVEYNIAVEELKRLEKPGPR